MLVWYWLAQAVAVYAVTMVWFTLMPSDESLFASPLLVGFSPFSWGIAWAVVAITAAQVVFLLPLRRPGAIGAGGRSVRMSLAVAGLAAAAMVIASVLGLLSIVDEELERTSELMESTWGGGQPLLLLIVAVLWVVPTVLLIALVRRGRRETVLGRLATWILAGTAAEIALLIPIDIMVRRRMNCYCGEGSFLALTLLGWIGFFAAGPAVIAPWIGRCRRGWYKAHCAACGYDMSATPEVACCPECGTGWVAGRGSVIPGSATTKGG